MTKFERRVAGAALRGHGMPDTTLMWDALIGRLEAALPAMVREGRLLHILSVRDYALELTAALGLGLDPAKVEVAALCHDLAKHRPPEEQLALAAEAGIVPNAVEQREPWILHQKTSAWLAERDFGITDAAILNAVRKHTTAGPDMSPFDQLLYCADSLEPRRDFPGVDELRTLVREDLAAGYRATLAHTLRYVLDRGLPIHPASVEAWNALVLPEGKLA